MSHASTIIHASEMHAASPRTRSAFGTLSAVTAAAVIASLLTATVLSRGPAAAEERNAAVVPAARVAPAASHGTSVPEASAVFKGKDTPVEEPAPTF